MCIYRALFKCYEVAWIAEYLSSKWDALRIACPCFIYREFDMLRLLERFQPQKTWNINVAADGPQEIYCIDISSLLHGLLAYCPLPVQRRSMDICCSVIASSDRPGLFSHLWRQQLGMPLTFSCDFCLILPSASENQLFLIQ